MRHQRPLFIENAVLVYAVGFYSCSRWLCRTNEKVMAFFRRPVSALVLVQSLGIAEGRGGARGPENVWGSAATGAHFMFDTFELYLCYLEHDTLVLVAMVVVIFP